MHNPLTEYQDITTGQQVPHADYKEINSLSGGLPLCCHEGRDCLYVDAYVEESVLPDEETPYSNTEIITYEKDIFGTDFYRELSFDKVYLSFRSSDLLNVEFNGFEREWILDLNKTTAITLELSDDLKSYPLFTRTAESEKANLNTTFYNGVADVIYQGLEYRTEWDIDSNTLKIEIYYDETELIKTYSFVFTSDNPKDYAQEIVTGTEGVKASFSPHLFKHQLNFLPDISEYGVGRWVLSDTKMLSTTWAYDGQTPYGVWHIGGEDITGNLYAINLTGSDYILRLSRGKNVFGGNGDWEAVIDYDYLGDDSYRATYTYGKQFTYEEFDATDGIITGVATLNHTSTEYNLGDATPPSSISWEMDGLSFVPPPIETLITDDLNPSGYLYLNDTRNYLNAFTINLHDLVEDGEVEIYGDTLKYTLKYISEHLIEMDLKDYSGGSGLNSITKVIGNFMTYSFTPLTYDEEEELVEPDTANVLSITPVTLDVSYSSDKLIVIVKADDNIIFKHEYTIDALEMPFANQNNLENDIDDILEHDFEGEVDLIFHVED